MALSELAALDAAYQTLQPLDPAGRRRALQWLADALAIEVPLTTLTADPVDTADTAAATAAANNRGAKATPTPNPRRTAKPAARQPRRPTAAALSETATPPPASKRTRGTRARAATAGTAHRAQADSRPGARAYRRMPPADEVMAAYQRIGSVAGLAAHFAVPGHTVQGWARQLRRHGYPIGQTR